MPPPPTPLAIPHPSALHFFRNVLSETKSLSSSDSEISIHTILLVCFPRQAFLQALLDSPATPSDYDLLNSLLTPTFSTLATSAHIKIVFTPTVQHLRAYLSSLHPRASPPSPPPVLLAIWGLVEAHAETSEYSAQGIGRTVASLVAAGVRTGLRIIVGGLSSRESAEGSVHEGQRDGIQAGMDVQVPVLNSTVKLGKEVEVIARGRVNVRDIFLRWFIWKEYEDEAHEEPEDAVVVEAFEGEVQEPHLRPVTEDRGECPLSTAGESDDDEL